MYWDSSIFYGKSEVMFIADLVVFFDFVVDGFAFLLV